LYELVKSGKDILDNGHIYNVRIAGDKNIAPSSIVSSGIPIEIWQKPAVEEFARKEFGTNNVKFLRPFFTTSDIRMNRACFEFEVEGIKTAFRGKPPEIYESGKIREEPGPSDTERVNKIWRVIEDTIRVEPTESGEVFFADVLESIGKAESLDTNSDGYAFYDDVPNYYRGGSGAPGGDWGCGPPCAASVIGTYHRYYHEFEGPPDPPDAYWFEYDYGWWILGGKQYTPHQDSLYAILEGMCGPGESPKISLVKTLRWGQYQWLYRHLPEGLQILLYGVNYKDPFYPETDWYTYIDPRFSESLPITLLYREKTAPLSDGHYVTGVGYTEDPKNWIRLIYYDHDYVGSSKGEDFVYYMKVYEYLGDFNFAIIYSDRYRAGGSGVSALPE
jgi:hypothetical protein